MKKKSVFLKKSITKRSHTRGISLIEVLIGVVLMSVVMLGFLSLYNTGQKYFVNQEAKSDILNDSRVSLTWIINDIKEAVKVEPGPVEIFDVSYSTTANSVVLRVPSVDANGMVVDKENHQDYMVYILNPENPNQLLRILDAKDGQSHRKDKIRVLAGNISSLVFSYFDADGTTVSEYDQSFMIDVVLTAEKKGVQRSYQEVFTTRAKLRNKDVT